ncbi:MAG TPA: transcriptional regulator, partial [bacterium]|nr:transcriptional regulator [bacterium]
MHKALHKSQELFTATWGEISTFWGINKVMGQLYALLFASAKPLTLDDMCERLQISRGNASMNIRA